MPWVWFRAPLDWHASFAWVTDRETQQRVLQLPSQLKIDMLSGESGESAISPCIYKNGSKSKKTRLTFSTVTNCFREYRPVNSRG